MCIVNLWAGEEREIDGQNTWRTLSGDTGRVRQVGPPGVHGEI